MRLRGRAIQIDVYFTLLYYQNCLSYGHPIIHLVRYFWVTVIKVLGARKTGTWVNVTDQKRPVTIRNASLAQILHCFYSSSTVPTLTFVLTAWVNWQTRVTRREQCAIKQGNIVTAKFIARVYSVGIFVQRSAARFAWRDHKHTSSVTAMLQKLQWDSLQERRAHSRVIMLYRIRNDLVGIPASTYLQPVTSHTRGSETRYRQIQCNTNLYSYTFFPTAICLWNTLPVDVCQLPPARFKTQLDSVQLM